MTVLFESKENEDQLDFLINMFFKLGIKSVNIAWPKINFNDRFRTRIHIPTKNRPIRLYVCLESIGEEDFKIDFFRDSY